MVTKMAIPTRLQDLMLDCFIGQPKFNVGPFIVCNRPLSNYPNSAITLFNDDGDWGRISYKLKEDSEGSIMAQLTKPKDIFIGGQDYGKIKGILKKEASELGAIVLFNRYKFPNDPAIQLDVISHVLMQDTFVFMRNYFAYQDYLLHCEINRIANGSHKKSW